MTSGPIVLIEDDADDKELLDEVLKELNIPNKIVWFRSCPEAFDFLKAESAQPFLIISDINLPGESGLEFKRRIDDDVILKKKSIPFVFFTTSGNKSHIDEAYTELVVQGYFQKAHTYQETKNCVKAMMEYWKYCKHPNAD